eukprot:jgi/Chlat1/2976/Chrsp2S00364
MVLLHGRLDLEVVEARNLGKSQRGGQGDGGGGGGFFSGFIRQVTEVVDKDPDAFATVYIGPVKVAETEVRDDNANPGFNERFAINVESVDVNIKDGDYFGHDLLGVARIPANLVMRGEDFDQWFPLTDDNGNQIDEREVRVHMWAFESAEEIAKAAPMVPHTYFHIRKGCRIHLYKDAHVRNNEAPEIQLDNGGVYEIGRAWEDVFKVIRDAQHFIYITGWSVYTEIHLIRDPERPVDGDQGLTLGELLKQKADEQGCRVLLQVWDDKTSNPIVHSGGLMATHDQQTDKYFEDSSVECVLVSRLGPDDNFAQAETTGFLFSHHQKTIMADNPAEDGRKRLVAFVGGLDLCDGRYDSSSHPLFEFSASNWVYSDDFHQPCITGATVDSGAPREPWHDIHSKLEGPVAFDVLKNFEQRWMRQAPEDIRDKFLPPEQVPDLITGQQNDNFGDPDTFATSDDDPENWRAHLFRSIDSNSADLPTGAEALKYSLSEYKGVSVDHSIQNAYIHAIRRAQHFVYIENQYFLGSCQAWSQDTDTGCYHLVPVELALKIASKIRNGERFAAYIITPLYPEGVPDSGAVQEILHYQGNTMRMMYRIIAEALAETGSDAHPQDYLNFYTVVNRAAVSGDVPSADDLPGGEHQYLAQKNGRFMIYVHAKMMLVDDEYIIVGSANINQRSMDGARDTEIAVGAFQPAHTVKSRRGGLPRAQVHGLRMECWHEHTGTLEEVFLQPHEVDCVHRVNEIAQENWQVFMADEPSDMRGHLVPFPVTVGQDGSVEALPGCEDIPDWPGARILGQKSGTLPSLLTS